MAKIVYSLVLAEEVVAAVDILAAKQGYSRSSLVNHILAEYACLATPENYIIEMLHSLQQAASEEGLRLSASSNGTLTFRTALCYKYNPTLTYTVELRSTEGLARLHVALRSQNQQVLNYFNVFFSVWGKLESRHLPQPPSRKTHTVQPKKYTRVLRRPAADLSSDEAGQAVIHYISMVDSCMKTFFAHMADAQEALEETERCYLQGLDRLIGYGQL